MSKSPEEDPSRVSPHVWVPSTYFAEGFPYTLVNSVAEVLFKELGASLGAVGLTSLLHLPWNLKFLWAPLLDRYETKRTFLIAMQLLGAVLLVALACAASGPGFLGALWVLFLLLAFVSATNDIAIDGYYMEALDATDQSRFVGYRASAYKIASLFVKGGLPVLAGVAGWTLGLLGMAVVLFGTACFHLWLLPRSERRQASLLRGLRRLLDLRILLVGTVLGAGIASSRWFVQLEFVQAGLAKLGTLVPALAKISISGWIGIALLVSLIGLVASARHVSAKLASSDSIYARGFLQFASMPGAGRLLAFVVLFRTGESLLGKMKWPFLSDQLGMSLEAYGLANGVVGVLASFTATFWGGRAIARDGLRRWFWPFLLAQNVLNLLYVLLASIPGAGVGAVTCVIAVEEFGSGLGTAVFMVLLMRSCHPDYKATHFALLTALMSVSFTLAGTVSGFLAELLGYAGFFGLSFVATFPMMILAGPVVRALPRVERAR